MLYQQFTFPAATQSATEEVAAELEDEVVLEGLQEYVQYTVQVRASNEDGYGPFSTPVSATTFQDGQCNI